MAWEVNHHLVIDSRGKIDFDRRLPSMRSGDGHFGTGRN